MELHLPMKKNVTPSCSYQDIDVRNCKECSNVRTCPLMKIYLELIEIKEILNTMANKIDKGRSY